MPTNPIKALFSRLDIPKRFQVDHDALATGELPVKLRKPRWMALLSAMTSPLVAVYMDFLTYYDQTRRELSYNGQTMQLERALNDRFDPALARIYIIGNDTVLEGSYDNFVEELQPAQYMGFISEAPPYAYDYDFSEILNQVGFTVKVPVGLRSKEFAINARIKQLKLAMIKHQIQYF
ncbi:MAG: hypothetical protein V4621_08085 [Pseudomonadota bacterium]